MAGQVPTGVEAHDAAVVHGDAYFNQIGIEKKAVFHGGEIGGQDVPSSFVISQGHIGDPQPVKVVFGFPGGFFGGEGGGGNDARVGKIGEVAAFAGDRDLPLAEGESVGGHPSLFLAAVGEEGGVDVKGMGGFFPGRFPAEIRGGFEHFRLPGQQMVGEGAVIDQGGVGGETLFEFCQILPDGGDGALGRGIGKVHLAAAEGVLDHQHILLQPVGVVGELF